MKVPVAYVSVVLIWSTTPLAIHWSNSSVSFIAAVTLRMLLACVLCIVILALLRRPLIKQKKDWLVFALSALGLFPNMALVYWAAQYIPSGLMSVLMGVYPFLVGIFSWLFFREKSFTPTKVFAVCLAVAGLIIVNLGQLQVGAKAALGVGAILTACILWAISSVFIKHLGAGMHPIRIGAGSMLVALPFFLLTWWITDGTVPEVMDGKSLFGIAYLVVAGSLLGHSLFFYILRECQVVTVSLITLLAPVLAVTWGALLAGESLSLQTKVGAGVILSGLVLYQGLVPLLLRKVRAGRKALPRDALCEM